MEKVMEVIGEFLGGEKKPEPEAETAVSEFPRKGGNGSGTEDAYTVEARSGFKEPQQFGKQIFDQRWKDVQFDHAQPPLLGVPVGRGMMADRLGYYSYPAAQALRWWFHANAHASFSGMCLETRIVRHKVEYSYSAEAISAHAVISGEDRSNLMPDWNK